MFWLRLFVNLGHFLLEESANPSDIVLTSLKVRVVDDFDLEWDRGFDATDHEFSESTVHACNGDLTCGASTDEFGDH